MIYAFFECFRNFQCRFKYVCETVEEVEFCVYTVTCNENFFFSFFFFFFAFIVVVSKRLSTNQNVKSIEVINY